jgi:hypothetical protein
MISTFDLSVDVLGSTALSIHVFSGSWSSWGNIVDSTFAVALLVFKSAHSTQNLADWSLEVGIDWFACSAITITAFSWGAFWHWSGCV